MAEPRTYPELLCVDRAAWDAWLAKHHATSTGVRLVLAKKGSGVDTVSPSEAVEVALTWGWIDGQANRRDEQTFCLRFTRRTPKSIWSKINRDRVLGLIEAGKMHPSGMAEVERARADGRWDRAYDSPRTAQVPDDLAAALAKHPRARRAFDALDATNRYAILHRLHHTVKPETRVRKIDTFVAMLERGEVHHPDRARKTPPASRSSTSRSKTPESSPRPSEPSPSTSPRSRPQLSKPTKASPPKKGHALPPTKIKASARKRPSAQR